MARGHDVTCGRDGARGRTLAILKGVGDADLVFELEVLEPADLVRGGILCGHVEELGIGDAPCCKRSAVPNPSFPSRYGKYAHPNGCDQRVSGQPRSPLSCCEATGCSPELVPVPMLTVGDQNAESEGRIQFHNFRVMKLGADRRVPLAMSEPLHGFLPLHLALPERASGKREVSSASCCQEAASALAHTRRGRRPCHSPRRAPRPPRT